MSDADEELRRAVRRGQRRRLKIWLVVIAALAVLVSVLVGSGVFDKKSRIAPSDNKEGCPCGCDHSEKMAAELRTRPKGAALSSIDKSLATIAEREDAGYVTERMVVHRLRLLDLERELGRTDVLRPARTSAWNLLVMENATLRAGAELIVHGEATELVDGREKLLRACFLVRMDLENLLAEDRVVEKPAVTADVSFPIARWYLKGGAGEHWDGILKGHERKSIHVLGYLGTPVKPGTEIEAVIRFESLTFRTSTRARLRWNDLKPSDTRNPTQP